MKARVGGQRHVLKINLRARLCHRCHAMPRALVRHHAALHAPSVASCIASLLAPCPVSLLGPTGLARDVIAGDFIDSPPSKPHSVIVAWRLMPEADLLQVECDKVSWRGTGLDRPGQDALLSPSQAAQGRGAWHCARIFTEEHIVKARLARAVGGHRMYTAVTKCNATSCMAHIVDCQPRVLLLKWVHSLPANSPLALTPTSNNTSPLLHPLPTTPSACVRRWPAGHHNGHGVAARGDALRITE